MQKIFLANKKNGAKEIQNVISYIHDYNSGEKTFIEGTSIVLKDIGHIQGRSNGYFKGRTSCGAEILLKVAENTVEGLIFEIVKIDINKAIVYFLGKNILYVCNHITCRIINLNTMNVILEIPTHYTGIQVLDSKGENVVFEYIEQI